jgi:hypothetical protein
MSYAKIPNLYKEQTILMFKECFALEKIHGTSAHIAWSGDEDERTSPPKLTFYSGGEKHDKFVALFDQEKLVQAFQEMGHSGMVVYGEAYGGKQQGMSKTYGADLKFVVFDVLVEGWLSVPSAESVAQKLGLEFVHYVRIPTDLASIDAERDAPSIQARRNGILEDKNREGVVLRPIVEVRLSDGERVICKHKREEERETKTPREVMDPAKLNVLIAAEEIANEWVVPNRLQHVLNKMPGANIEQMRDVINAMVQDVLVEGAGEIVDSKEARAAISKKTAILFKQYLKNSLKE